MAQPELAEDWCAWLSLAQALSAAVEAQDWERAVMLAEQLVAAQATLSPLSALPAAAHDEVLAELLSAQRLLQAGFTVAGYDIAPDRRENLARLGGIACASAKEIGERCKEIVLTVSNTDQVEFVLESTEGACLNSKHLVICTST